MQNPSILSSSPDDFDEDSLRDSALVKKIKSIEKATPSKRKKEEEEEEEEEDDEEEDEEEEDEDNLSIDSPKSNGFRDSIDSPKLNGTQESVNSPNLNGFRDSMDSPSSPDPKEKDFSTPEKKRTSLLPSPEFRDNSKLDIILAIRAAILEAPSNLDPITNEDFKFTKTYKLSRIGNIKPWKAKDFAPAVFHRLRLFFNVPMAEFLASWSNTEIISEKSSGKSSSFFFYSSDRKFVLKSLTQSESKQLRKMLEEYYQHIISNPQSLLSKIFGHQRVTIKGRSTYFIIMENVFHSSLTLHETYDLKGSTIGRESDKKTSSILKDNDFLASNRRIALESSIAQPLIHQIESDCQLLEKLNLMDYSLLIGIHRLPEESAPEINNENDNSVKLASSDAPKIKRSSLKLQSTPSLKKIPSHVFFCEGSKGQTIKKRKITKKSLQNSGPPEELHKVIELPPMSNTVGIKFNQGILSFGKQEIYFLGIIDFLQKYNSKKKMARMAKTLRYTTASAQLSTIKPNLYATRFKTFLQNNVILVDRVEPRRGSDSTISDELGKISLKEEDKKSGSFTLNLLRGKLGKEKTRSSPTPESQNQQPYQHNNNGNNNAPTKE